MVELADPLASSRPELQLPVDFRRAAHTASRLETYDFELALPASVPMSVEPHALITAVFGILLARWSGQPSVDLRASRWTATKGREPAPILQLTTSLDTTCRELLAQVANQQGLRELPAVKHGRAVGFTWLDAAPSEELRALEIAGTSESDDGAELHLVAVKSGDGFRAAFVYDAELFRATSIERFAGQLQALLTGALESLDAPIAQLPLLAPAERRTLEAACTGRTTGRLDEPFHRRFERHALLTPEATAVRYRDRSLTYHELNARANRLARHLVGQGLGPEEPVLVCVEPSLDILVALLAILKAGAVYVPVDPTYPAHRIAAIVDDTRPKLLLTQSHLVAKLPLDGVATLPIDAADSLLRDLPDGDLGHAIDPEQTAYVYYTSGTTGKPKGVMASHANLTSYVRLARERYGFDDRDVVPAIARFSFSISMFELATPLSAGGTVVILDRDHILDPARLSATLTEVTLFHAGPSLLKNLLPYIQQHVTDRRAFARVRHASSGGDMIPPHVLESLRTIFSSAEIFVIYGCSEIACMGCTYPVPASGPIERTYVGRPFDDMAVRVTDAAGNLLPIGMVGEVHFAGNGIVKGYLRRPELTGEKFITREGRRFYRTGDLGRISESGWLELVGRSDFQVKIRGMRIELAEVEHHLRTAPGVRDGVVVARDSASGEKILVAFVVIDPTTAAQERRTRKAALRRHLADRLPDYMVPSVIAELASLPVNHNLKLDRRSLPDLSALDDGASDEPRPPETPNEKNLAVIWKTILGCESVGLDDNFFELGGDSLLGAKLIAEVERSLGVTLDGMQVLRESLEVLAEICDARHGKPAAKARSAASRDAARSSVQPFHFGPGKSLYGVLHGRETNGQAALICAPPGQEHVRAHFVLGQLARRLAAQGVPVLRFDLFGTGCSLGDGRDATCARWQRDIEHARAELERRSGATRITAIGVRLGAALLWNRLPSLGLARVVLWDPICEVAEHIDTLEEGHRRYLRATERAWEHSLSLRRWVRLRVSTLRGTEKELLGASYSSVMLRELRSLRLTSPPPVAPQLPIRWLATHPVPRQRPHFEALCRVHPETRVETMEVDCSWSDVTQLESILPDAGLSVALARMATVV